MIQALTLKKVKTWKKATPLLEEERMREDCDNNKIIAMDETDTENY